MAVDTLLKELESEISELLSRYLDQYFPADPEHTPDKFEYDVKSFCVLAHACFEEFAEQISNVVLREIPKDFLAKKLTVSAVLLLLSYAERANYDIDEDADLDSCFDIVRKAIDDCKAKHSGSIKDNHGFSKKYLRKMLVPVGINVRFDPAQESSIKKLATARGSFAHSKSRHAAYGEYHRAKTPLSPDEAKEIALDCIGACKTIAKSVEARW